MTLLTWGFLVCWACTIVFFFQNMDPTDMRINYNTRTFWLIMMSMCGAGLSYSLQIDLGLT